MLYLAAKQAPSSRKAPEKQPTRPTGHSESSTLASGEPSKLVAKRAPRAKFPYFLIAE